jgi:hypothetical protein
MTSAIIISRPVNTVVAVTQAEKWPESFILVDMTQSCHESP